jgi:hypothetical protein
MESQASMVNTKKLIFTPAQHDDPPYRQWVYDQWMAEVSAATAAFADCNNSPYYGNGTGWRVD